jgi:hypothetical protein
MRFKKFAGLSPRFLILPRRTLKPAATGLFCFFLVVTLHAEIIDRTMAVAGNRIITLSDVRQERNIQLALGQAAAKDDDAIVRELADTYLIEAQIAQFPGVEVDGAEIEAELNKIQNRQGVSIETLRQSIRRRLQISRYFDVRFRQFINASEEEIQTYYRNVFVPEAEKRGLTPVPPLENVAQLIRNNVVEEKMKQDIDTWLEAVRRGSEIEIFD